jgi:universal stress protein E
MVVIDPTTDQQPAFERALDSAQLTGAGLHLYLCVDEEAGYAREADAQQALQPRLDELTARAEAADVQSTAELEWADAWRKRAVAAAARCSASMVFKGSFDHSSVQREIRQTADWTLLRTSPCPVLLVKNYHDWKHRRVLAAIKPDSTDEAHIRLNNQIISVAQGFARAYGSDAHFVAAFYDLNHPPVAEELARACGAPVERVHLGHGRAADVIRDTAETLDVDLIILGTVGRDGIKGQVVGNTSERLLDQTHSDLLVLN